jgi:hypothetical protein
MVARTDRSNTGFRLPRIAYRAKNVPTNFTQYVDPIGSSASLKSAGRRVQLERQLEG